VNIIFNRKLNSILISGKFGIKAGPGAMCFMDKDLLQKLTRKIKRNNETKKTT